MKVDILGRKYTICIESHEENAIFEEKGWCGYCSEGIPEIHILNLDNCTNYKDDSEEAKRNYTNMTLRHEIVHAFLNESGLMCCANQFDGAWSKNEEMVDWVSIQFPKILKAFQKCGCI